MENNQLTPNDIASMINIIDVCTSRGAFRANELKNVGIVYEKMTLFLNTLKENSKKEPDQLESNTIEEIKTIN